MSKAKGSKFSIEDRQEYAHAHGLGPGWMVASSDGRYDRIIEATLANDSVGAPRCELETPSDHTELTADEALKEKGIDPRHCSNCRGTGQILGATARCNHLELFFDTPSVSKEEDSLAGD